MSAVFDDIRPQAAQPLESTARDDEREFARASQNVFSETEAAPADFTPLSQRMLREFTLAESQRRLTEQRWLKDLRQYRGKYEPEIEKELAGRSKAFVRKTRVKIKTVDSRVADLLFPAGAEKNWDVTNTPVPSVSDEQRANVTQMLQQQAAQAMQAAQAQQAQAAQQQSAQQPDPSGPIASPAQSAQPPQITPDQVDQAIVAMAKESAKRMSKVMEDQLSEARYKQTALQVIHSAHLYGTGIIKGPLVERKVRTRFMQKGKRWVAESEEYTVPFFDYVPLWRFYPDMNVTDKEQCHFIYECHTMTKANLLGLAKRPSFASRAKEIVDYVQANKNGAVVLRYYDNELKELGERMSTQAIENGQYEVLERWGWLDGDDLVNAGVKIPPDRLHESFFSNVWLLPNGTVIKAVLQPINGVTWPYHMYYFDKDETSIFGEGIAAIMRDDQEMLNAATRMMLDNGALTSGPMVEIFMDLLATTEGATALAPWKVYLRNSTDRATSAVRPIQLENNLEFLQAMAKMFESNADKVTAIPEVMSGPDQSLGAAGTASGLSMQLGAQNIAIKDLINSYDEGVTRTMLESLYHWNMQFHKDNDIKGDYDVVARGTASLVAKEVRARQLNEFAQLVANPEDAQYIKRANLLRQRAEALELSDIVMTDEEVKEQQGSEQAQKQQQMREAMLTAQVEEQMGKAKLANANAELAQTKVTELLKRVEEMAAKIEKIAAETVQVKTDTIYAATQAGGVATNSPYVAPAADEVLRSAGFESADDKTSIANLDTTPVQQTAGTNMVLNKGQSFAVEPRGGDQGQPGASDVSPAATSAAPGAGGPPTGTEYVAQPGTSRPRPGVPPSLQGNSGQKPPTGQVGETHGIETARIERPGTGGVNA